MLDVKPTEQLIEEHNSILKMLGIIDHVCNILESGEAVPYEHLDQIVEFIRLFADKIHHGKEEDLLFPAMEAAGFPRESGPIGVMLVEHEQGRDYVNRLDKAVTQYKNGEQTAADALVRHARNYVFMLTQHIDKENTILYPMADSSIPIVKQEALLDEFESVNKGVINTEKLTELQDNLNNLEEIYAKK
ncbi:MAG: hemerythrin domain-containing protein [Candidatus Neomarinimicrobiota bacterium]